MKSIQDVCLKVKSQNIHVFSALFIVSYLHNLSCVKLNTFKLIFTGNALLRRLVRIGVLDESKMKLDYVLGLKLEDFLERRLQTQVFKLGLAKSIHHARVLIRQRHIRYDYKIIK